MKRRQYDAEADFPCVRTRAELEAEGWSFEPIQESSRWAVEPA